MGAGPRAPPRVSGKEEEMREGKRRGRYVVYERGLLHPCAAALGGAGSRAARATTSARRWGCLASCSSSASRASCTTPRGARCWTRRGKRGGCGCDGRGAPRLPARCSGPARGPPPARPAMRPSLSLRGRETLPRGRLPRPLRSRRRRPASGCIRSLAHGRDHSAASRAAGSRSGLPNAPSGSPSGALRSQVPRERHQASVGR